MENFIRIFENVVPDNWCESLVQKFEDFEEHHEVVDNKMSFTQINFGRDSLWKYESDYLEKVILEQVERYREDVKIENQWPQKYALEPIRMKRYLPNEKDNFPPHVDVTGKDNNSRFLVMFLYLSNNAKGETIFLRQNAEGWGPKVSSCHRGNMLIFPSLWPWLHRGNFPVTSPKYIVGSYLHYVD